MRANLIAALLGMLCVVGCGGGGSLGSTGGSGGGGTTSGANVQSVTVDTGPPAVANSRPAVNTLYTTVTICAPGTSTCQTIDHIQVDTGSSGMRIMASVLTISLPLATDSNNNVIAECVPFVDGSSWGPLRKADIKIASEIASNQSVQIIGDPTYAVPSTCSGTAENTVATFGANGILGVGLFLQDCGQACTVQSTSNPYYTCASGQPCAQTPIVLTQQVANPVASFTTDNNGVIIELPSATDTSAALSGSLIFGIGTQSNNGLGNAKIFTVGASGSLSTTYNGNALDQSFIDSGSNAYYFPDSNIIPCPTGKDAIAPGFYCPTSTLNLSASIVGGNGASSNISFMVGDAVSMFTNNTTVGVAPALAGSSLSVNTSPSSGFNGNQTFDWGLPFYYGRSVSTAIEGQNTSAGMGPYFAF